MTPQDPEVTSNQTKEDIPLISPRLKALVIWQGVAIIIGIVVIFGTLAYRAVNMISDVPEPSVSVSSLPAVSDKSYSAMEGTVQAPKGSQLHKVHAGEVTVTLEFLHEDGQTTLIFVDVASGLEQGRLLVETQR